MSTRSDNLAKELDLREGAGEMLRIVGRAAVFGGVVVVLGLIVAFSLVGPDSSSHAGRDHARTSSTISSMGTVVNAIRQYQLDNGGYPPTLNALVPKYLTSAPTDAWKRPFVYSVSAPLPSGEPVTPPFILESTGADGKSVIDYWDSQSK